MKTYLSIIAIVFFCSESRAQDEYDTLFKLNKVWVNAKEESWSFNNRQVSPYSEYRDFSFYVYNHKIYMRPVYADSYYDSEEEEIVDCIFQVCKVTNDELVLYPLNEEAISLMDGEREMYDVEPRSSLYKAYLKELKAAGNDQKKRNQVIFTYKGKHNLDADTLKFVPRSSYFEAVKIDSVDVSLTWNNSIDETTKRQQFNDLRWIPATNKYYFGYRFKDSKIPPPKGGTLEFLPPVVMEDYEMEEPFQLKETAQDSLMRILDEAPAGWYTGKFDPVGTLLLEASLQSYGLNKPHNMGKKEDSSYSVRVYHDGKYTDFYVNSENASCLQEHFVEFVENWTYYVKTFEAVKNETIVFPIARSN